MPDAAVLRLERWYMERLPVTEVCVVALAAEAAAPAHLHAVLVPDFAVLREQGHCNSRELLRFEFQTASKMLPAGERPHSFEVRSRALPRRKDGEIDRGRLEGELGEPAVEKAHADGAGDTVEAEVYRLVREFRGAADLRDDANLELDLGFDSLDRVLLMCTVEKRFGVAIPAERAAGIFTVGELAEEVRARSAAGSQAWKATPRPRVSWAELLQRPLDAQQRAQADSILKPRPVFTWLAWGVVRLLRGMFARRFQFAVQGRESLPARGPYLLVANHCSHLDPLFLLWALPFGATRRLSFMGHTEYFGSGWKGALARRLKLVPVDPDGHALEGMMLCAEALRRGLIGAVFPEGERSADGAQQRFHCGIAQLAMHLEVPIVPVAIAGTYEVLPRGEEHIRPAPVQVRIGRPLRAEGGENEQDLLARTWAAVWELRGAEGRSRETIPRPMRIYTQATGGWSSIGSGGTRPR